MNKIWLFLLLSILVCFFTNAETQRNISSTNQNTIKGVVIENDGTPAMFVAVAIIRDEKIVTGDITDTTGSFVLKGNFEGNNLLRITSVGHNELQQQIKLSKGQTLDLGNIHITEKSTLLEGVVVTENRAEKTVTVEKTTINPNSSLQAATGSVLDAIKNSPAVMVDNDGQVSLRGNSNILILIDGVPTTLDGLSAIPVSNIQSIDIVTSPDVKYDSEGTGGIISIVSKKQIPNAFNMMLSANYGFLTFANGNFAMSYNKNKWGIRLNYNGKYEKDKIHSDLFRHILLSNEKIDQGINATKKNSMQNIGMNIQYKLNAKNALSLDLKTNFPRMNNFRTFNNHYTSADAVRSDKFRQTDITFNREVVEASLSYKHSFDDKKTELSTAASMSLVNGHRPSYYYENEHMVQYSNSGGHPRIATYALDIMTMLGKGKLEMGIKMTYRQNNIEHKMFDWDEESNDWQLSLPLSNDLQHREYIPATYAMYSAKINDKFTYKLGVRFEYSYVKLKNRKDQLNENNNCYFVSPNIVLSYAVSDSWLLSWSITRRISRPTYPQLNPYINLIDDYNYEIGNVRLKPEKANKADFDYAYTANKLKINGNAYVNYIQDYINQIAYVDQNILVTTYVNGKHYLNTGIEHNLKWNPLRWLSVELGVNAFYTKSHSGNAIASFINQGLSCNTSSSLNFMPVKGMTIQVQYFVTSPQHFPQFTTKTIHYGNIGLRQQVCKNALTLSVLCTDVFNTQRWDITSENPIYTLINNNKNQSRIIWLGISWNFHSYKPMRSQSKQEENRAIIRIGE